MPENKWNIGPPFFDFLNTATAAFFGACTAAFYILVETLLLTMVEFLSILTFGEIGAALKSDLQHIFLYSKLATGGLLAVLMVVRIVRGYDKLVR